MIYFTHINKPIKHLKTHHYRGDFQTKELMEVPEILILEEEEKRTFLYRYTLKGEFVGDTWHPNLEEAKDQAEFEYGDAFEGWKEIPHEVKDYLPYILNQIKKTNQL